MPGVAPSSLRAVVIKAPNQRGVVRRTKSFSSYRVAERRGPFRKRNLKYVSATAKPAFAGFGMIPHQ